MGDQHTSDLGATLSNASRAQRKTRAASRWYPRYLLLMGVLAFVLIVVGEVFFPSGSARVYAALAVWVLPIGLLSWWAASHDVYPPKARRRLFIAAALWFGSYLFVIGPLVRWQADTSLLWWSVAAAVMASPFLVAAWRERRRS